MRRLFKWIISLIVTVLFVPVLMLFLFYKSATVPVDDYASSGTIDIMELLNNSVNAFLEDTSEPLRLQAGTAEINALAREELIKALGKTPTDLEYVLKEENFGIQGAWLEGHEDGFSIIVGAHGFIAGFTYKTSIRMKFIVDSSADGEITFVLNKMSIGKLPIAWLSGIADKILNRVYAGGADSLVNDMLGDMATFSLKERKLTIDVKEAVSGNVDDPTTAAALDLIFNLIFEQELFKFKMDKTSLGFELGLNRIADNTPVYSVPAAMKIQDDDHLSMIIASKASSLLLSMLDAKSYIDLDELTFNRILEYLLRTGGLVDKLFETELLDEYMFSVGMVYTNLEENFQVIVPLDLTSKTDPTKAFKTKLTLSTEISLDGDDLVITLKQMDIGEIGFDEESIGLLLALVGENEFIVDQKIIIEGFKEKLELEEASISDIEVVSGKLRLHVELNNLDLTDLQQALGDALDAVKANYPEIEDLITDLLSGDDFEEAFDNIIDGLSNMSDQDQEDLLNELLDQLEQSGFDIDDYLNLIP